MLRTLALASLLLVASTSLAQDHAGMAMPKAPAKPSTSLKITGLDGAVQELTPEQLAAMPHVKVSVHNAHNEHDETYSGVPLHDLLKPGMTTDPARKVSQNMLVVIAGATDGFHVVLTLCDTNPECRNGQAVVADQLDGAPLAADGAFKLILTEDRKPARWARNLQSLTVRAVDAN